MSMKSPRIAVAALLFGIVGAMTHVTAAEPTLTVLCSNGLKAVVEELVPQFERTTKHQVVVKYGLAAALKQRIEGGETFDVAFVTPQVMDDLIAHGKIAGDSRTTIARSGLGIAVRAGAKKRDIATVEAFKRTLLDAKGIAYAKEGASGVAFAAIIQKLGITDALKAKSKLTVTGEEVGEAVVKGDSELGILPVSEILPVKGAEMLGTFPAEIQSYIVMVGGVNAGATQAAVARDLIKFVTAPAALPVIKAKGMERS
jgi:molybdate transport system substrate-binding protein